MRPVQILMDESLLRRLDADQEVRRFGRSAVLRRAASDYLRRAEAKRIADAYRLGYGKDRGLGEEFAGWQDEGSWPAK